MKNLFAFFAFALVATGCASGARDHYNNLNEQNCRPELGKIKVSAKKVISETPLKGEFSGKRCVLTETSRSAYDTFAFKADSSEMVFDIKVEPKSKGFGFGGNPTLAIPVMNIITKKGVSSFRAMAQKREHSIWTGDVYHYTFQLKGLQAGATYPVVLTTDNETPGRTVASQANQVSNGVGGFIEVNNDIQMGPYGEFEIKKGEWIEEQ